MNNMKPILFSGPMVRAILEGRKSQTRRIVKPEIKDCTGAHKTYKEAEWCNEPPQFINSQNAGWYCRYCGNGTDYKGDGFTCPYGNIGDILYVRENYYQFGRWITEGITKKTKKLKWKFVPEDDDVMFTDKVDAMGETFQLEVKSNSYRNRAWYKRLARFMPRKYARIFLKITDIRVERLQEIQPDDATAEGIEFVTEYLTPHVDGPVRFYKDYSPGCETFEHANPVESFETLWRKINGEESWNENPFVWVITFEKIDKPTNV